MNHQDIQTLAATIQAQLSCAVTVVGNLAALSAEEKNLLAAQVNSNEVIVIGLPPERHYEGNIPVMVLQGKEALNDHEYAYLMEKATAIVSTVAPVLTPPAKMTMVLSALPDYEPTKLQVHNDIGAQEKEWWRGCNPRRQRRLK